jgi:hypothetical protein
MLEQGREGHYLSILAGLSAPFNNFEVADYRNRALHELGLAGINDSEAVVTYSAERLRLALAGEIDLTSALGAIKEICVARAYPRELYDFYLLHFALSDLQESDVQWYWDGANRGNIATIIRNRAEAFLQSVGNADC